jgi:O-antigen/teichoic acid export membrane protein
MDFSRLKSTFSVEQRFDRDVLWNVGSLAILGVAGVVINIIIARNPRYGEDGLGVFNQVFAFYIVLSQIAVGGIHLSTLKHVSHNQQDRDKCAAISAAALMLASGLAALVCLIAFGLRNWIAHIWDSPGIGLGITLVVPGLLFFSVNKVLICIVNGMRRMRAYAVFQGLRFVFIVLALLGIVALEWPADRLAASLTIAEMALFVILIIYVNLRVVSLWPTRAAAVWLKPHLNFGIRGCLSGVLSEMNTRVDVLMLGLFCGDALVGLYSFAAIPAEAIAQLPLVVRRNVDPVIGSHFAGGAIGEINAFARTVKLAVYAAMGVVGLIAVVAYPVGVRLFVANPAFVSTWPIFAILTGGIVLNSGYRAFYGVVLQGGRPGMHTMLVLAVMLVNVLLNVALIPLFRAYGAATATSLAFVVEAALIYWLARRLFGVTL